MARRAAGGHLSGIVNGIDASWDPRRDIHLKAHFGIGEWTGRATNAHAVRKAFGLAPSTGPLFAVVSRLVHQKGLDITCDVAPQIVAAGGQLVIIGGGEPQVEAQVQALARLPGAGGRFHRVRGSAGPPDVCRRRFPADAFTLRTLRVEPDVRAAPAACPQHATGGLVDTVEDGVTGFLFHGANADGLRRCVERAMRTFRLPGLLQAMRRAPCCGQVAGMRQGRAYLALYQQTCQVAA